MARRPRRPLALAALSSSSRSRRWPVGRTGFGPVLTKGLFQEGIKLGTANVYARIAS